VDLAVPRFGTWAGVTVVDGMRLRRVDTSGADDFLEDARPALLRNLDPAVRHALQDTLQRPTTVVSAPVPEPVLAAAAVPRERAQGLSRPGGGVLLTVPLSAADRVDVLLTIAAETTPDLAELDQLARRAARAITAAYLQEERVTLARTLRKSLLPAPLPEIAGVELGASYRPAQEATEIGGDFYDVTARPDGRWAVSIGDVCGKGVDAAVLTGQVRQSLRTAALVTDDPAATLRLVNQTLLGGDGTTFITAAFGVLEPDGSAVGIRLSSGGHPPPLLLRGGHVSTVDVQGTLIGMLPSATFQTKTVTLRPGDVLLLYTDGAPEARGPDGMLGVEAISDILADSANLSAQAITDRVMQFVVEHLHGWPHDDIALLAVRCSPA
jgi:serine phosphatase RsbU (regulator of sigma subunit)